MKIREDAETFLPPALLAEVEAAAAAEHRPAREILQEAMGLYMKRRRKAPPAPDPEERARAFMAWVQSHPETPPLSDEAIRRENLIRE